LTKPDAKAAIEAVAARHFRQHVILTDDVLLGGTSLTLEHTPRNSWLRKLLYAQDCIEPSFLAADEDYLALRPLGLAYFQAESVHTGYFFIEDMGTWLAGSPTATSYDRGMRNAWRLLREAAYPARGYASHMPQIVNKRLVNEIYDRFVIDADHAWLDEWSLYFNVASQLYPRHFAAEPYGTLGWPMRTGDWFPDITPRQPAFENYYTENYGAAGVFTGLQPLSDLEAKTERTLDAIAHARTIEMDGGGGHSPGTLALILTKDALSFMASGTVVAGKANVRRILLIDGAQNAGTLKGKLDMFVTDPHGAVVGGESVAIGDVCWMPLLPPERPGLYAIRFFATLDSGERLEARGGLTVIGDKPRP
jgi:hypothetical protein